ncbi:MAG: helicase (plasmid) [Pseudomonas rhizophila]|uniref:helicase n=1 Tax=Pseudomonas rhizophila TaxID=2045200 RepID=UPI003F6BAF6F
MTPKLTLFLPLEIDKAEELAAVDSRPAELFIQWSVHEIASAAVIQNSAAFAGHNLRADKTEKALAELITIGIQVERSKGQGEFGRLMAARFNRDNFNTGLNDLQRIPARLLDTELISKGGFVFPNGEWNFEFKLQLSAQLNPFTEKFVTNDGKEFTLTNQQARTFSVFKGELDESMDVQALAGTGKTYLIERMVDSLSRYRPLLLAYTQVQLQALMARIGPNRVTGMTFGQLATECLERDQNKPYRRAGKRAWSTHQLAPSLVAERLGFGPVGSMAPWQVAQTCNRMVMRFCFSRDTTLDTRHIPPLDTKLSELDKIALAQYAQVFWQQTIEPTDPRIEMPLRGYHRIKHLALALDTFIDPGYTHIIIDESHDLTWPMCAFLDRCPQPVITLGDACQRLDGNLSKRSPATRSREVVHSIRAGRQIEGVVNTLIDQNPVVRVAHMEGSRERDTKVVYYDNAEIPTEPTTILCNSEWGLFEWFQRLGNAGAKFSLLPGADKAFRLFVLDCIELFNKSVRPSHSALFKYTSWASLVKDMAKDDLAFIRIERMLKKGYKATDFEASLLWLDATGCAPIKLGRVADARNTEVDTVMLAPDLLSRIESGDRMGAAKALAAIYTGGTRARFKLIVPGEVRDWATDLSAKSKKS